MVPLNEPDQNKTRHLLVDKDVRQISKLAIYLIAS